MSEITVGKRIGTCGAEPKRRLCGRRLGGVAISLEAADAKSGKAEICREPPISHACSSSRRLSVRSQAEFREQSVMILQRRSCSAVYALEETISIGGAAPVIRSTRNAVVVARFEEDKLN